MKQVPFSEIAFGDRFYDTRCGSWLTKVISMYNFHYWNRRAGYVIWTSQTLVFTA